MDRRQKKTREAIFSAFTTLLAQKDVSRITVGQILEQADVGRATFYAHFETKEHLMQELCRELFCHIFDSLSPDGNGHSHIFHCDGAEDVFLHLFRHLQKNDNRVLQLLCGENNAQFLAWFREGLAKLVESQLPLFAHKKDPALPEDYWVGHICAAFIHTLNWWVSRGMPETCEQITDYFLRSI